MKWRREIDESTLWCDVHSEALSDSALNHQHVHSACLAFPPENGYIVPFHSIIPYTCPSTLLTLFHLQQSLLSSMLRTKYYFGGGQAFICFGGSLMHGTDFHVHSLFSCRCIHIHTWPCISDHWCLIRESHGASEENHFLKLQNKHRGVLWGHQPFAFIYHYTYTLYDREVSSSMLPSLITHNSHVSSSLSIKFKSHSFLLPLTLRLSTSLLSSIFLFLSLSLWFWSVWWSSIDPTVLTAVKRVAIGYHSLLFRQTCHLLS